MNHASMQNAPPKFDIQGSTRCPNRIMEQAVHVTNKYAMKICHRSGV
jgi:hypothetical protein